MAKSVEINIRIGTDAKAAQAAAVALRDTAKAAGDLTKSLAAYARAQQAAGAASSAAVKGDNAAAIAAQRLASSQLQTATAAAKTATAQTGAAVAVQKLVVAEQQAAAATARTAAAQSGAAAAAARAEQAALRLAQAQDRVAQTDMALPRTFAGVTSEVASVVRGMATLGAAMGAAQAVAASFAQAFQFKAQLDATTLSITAQLKGVRDSGQVFAEAAVFAERFKLTQEETTDAIAASIGVMRASKAPIEDILGVLARMQVLSPEQSLQEAAIALKALASGDTTSLVTRFEVGRDVAAQMKTEIQGGADAVAVVGQFLSDTGIGMDVLAAKTEGASGKLRDFAKAQEELKLAQAEFGEGPGMAFLEIATRATRGATNLASGADGLNAAAGSALSTIEDLSAGIFNWLNAMTGSVAPAQQAAAAAAELAMAADMSTGATDANTAAALANAAATGEQASFTAFAAYEVVAKADAERVAEAAAYAHSSALVEEAGSSLEAAAAAQELAAFQATLATLGGQVAGGLMTAGAAALILANQYGIASSEALRLIGLQAQLAGARINAAAMSDQRAGERSGGATRSGAALQARKDTERRDAAAARAAAARGGGGRAGGGGGGAGGGKTKAEREAEKAAKAAEKGGAQLEAIERKTGEKLIEIDTQTQDKLAAIDAKGAEKRAAALQKLNNDIATMSTDIQVDFQTNDFDKYQKDITDEQAAQLEAREQAEIAYQQRIAIAQEEARQTAASGDAELASDVLKIREEQARRLMDIEQRAAAAQQAGGDEAAIEADRQEAIAAVEAAAQTEIQIAQSASQQRTGAVEAEKQAVLAAAEEQKAGVISDAVEQAAGVKNASADATAQLIDDLRRQSLAWKTATGDVKDYNAAVGATPAAGAAPPAGDGESAGDPGTGTGTEPAASGGTQPVMNPAQPAMNPARPGMNPARGAANLQAGGGGFAGGGTIITDSGGRRHATGGGTLSNPGGSTLDLINDLPAINAAIQALWAAAESIPGGDARPALLQKYSDAVRLTGETLTALANTRNTVTEAASGTPINEQQVRSLVEESRMIARLMQDAILTAKVAPDQIARFAEAVTIAVELLRTQAELRDVLAETKGGALNIATVQKLADESQQVLVILNSVLIVASGRQREAFQQYADLVGQTVSILTDVANLRETLDGAKFAPLDMYVVQSLAAEATRIARVVLGTVLTMTEETVNGLDRYAGAAQSAIDLLNSVADLRNTLKDAGSPIYGEQLELLAREARVALQMIVQELVPTTEEEAAAIERYAGIVNNAFDVLARVVSLRKEATDAPGIIPTATLREWAGEARRALLVMREQILPTTEEEAADLDRYSRIQESGIGILQHIVALRKEAVDPAALTIIPTATIRAWAQEARRVALVVREEMLPATEEQVSDLERAEQATAAGVGVLKNILDLSGAAFADYHRPTDAQLDVLVDDADRIIQRVDAAAQLYSTEGLAAATAYGEAVGSVMGAFNEQLAFQDKLRLTDLGIDPARLAAFEAANMQLMGTAQRLGAQAATIPTADVAALTGVTSALSGLSEMLIGMSAVPWGNLPGIAAGAGGVGLGGGGGAGGAPITIYINNPPAALNVPALIAQITDGISAGIRARR